MFNVLWGTDSDERGGRLELITPSPCWIDRSYLSDSKITSVSKPMLEM